MVRSYARGDGTALERLATWDLSRQADIAGRALDALRRPSTRPNVPSDSHAAFLTVEDLDAAGGLHMELALAWSSGSDAQLDARLPRLLAIAEELLRSFSEHEPAANPARRWELAVALTLTLHGRFGLAATVLDRACGMFPDDGRLHLARGTVHEAFAMSAADLGPLLGARTPSRSTWQPRTSRLGTSIDVVWDAKIFKKAQLAKALADFRHASTLMPSSFEARLRLAHVHVLAGQFELATPLLMKVVADAGESDRRVGYLARLVLARIHERQHALDSAEEALRGALLLLPGGHSARIALVGLALRRGRLEDAAAMTRALLSQADPPTDPWWGYRYGEFWLLDLLLAELRKEVRG